MAKLTTMVVVVPDGVGPGDPFKVATPWGFEYDAACPDSCAPGDSVSIDIPATPEADAQLLAAVQRTTDDDGFMARIEDYCRQHSHLVLERGRQSTAEPVASFSLQTQEVHEGYTQLVEELLEQHIVGELGLQVEDFVGCVQRAGITEGADGHGLLRTIESLTDFDVFCATAWSKWPLGSARGRLLRARLAARTCSALPGERPAHWAPSHCLGCSGGG